MLVAALAKRLSPKNFLSQENNVLVRSRVARVCTRLRHCSTGTTPMASEAEALTQKAAQMELSEKGAKKGGKKGGEGSELKEVRQVVCVGGSRGLGV